MSSTERQTSGNGMKRSTTMTDMAEHAKPVKHRDHLWVLVFIAACTLLEVWASWLSIGAVSGFPKLGRMTTGWILPVSTEAYWGYAVWCWLAAGVGRRSRRFAMWSAAIMFALSLGGQESAHLIAAAHRQAPWYAVALVTALPLFAVGLTTVLIHLRQLDREEAAEAERRKAEADRQAAIERAEADERTELRASLAEAEAALDELRAELATALGGLAAATAKTEALTRKLEAASARKRGSATGRKRAPATARKPDAATGSATAPEAPADEAPVDLDSEAKVLWYLDKGYSASKAGVLAGLTDSRGRQIARDLAAKAPAGQDPQGG